MVGLWKGTDQARNHGMIANGFILTHCHNRSAHLIAGQTTSTRRIFEVLHLRDYKVVVLLSTMQQGILSMEIKYCVAAVKASWSQGALSPQIYNWYNWSVQWHSLHSLWDVEKINPVQLAKAEKHSWLYPKFARAATGFLAQIWHSKPDRMPWILWGV